MTGIAETAVDYSAPPSIYGKTSRRERVFINCWHQLPYELAAMWSVYGVFGESICVRSTVGAVARELPENIVIGRVQYVDYSKLPHEAQDERLRYFFKRRSFRTDRELRAIQYEDLGRKRVGLAHQINLNALIDAVYVAPKSSEYFDAVSAVSRAFNLACPIQRSKTQRLAFFRIAQPAKSSLLPSWSLSRDSRNDLKKAGIVKDKELACAD